MGIRVLCKGGCKVVFTDMKCEVKYKNKVILNGIKHPTTDLWTLPITPTAINEMGSHELGKDPCDQKTPHPGDWAAFAHSIRTRANAVEFSHQSLCNPTISSLMKALKKGFLKGCPDLSKNLVTKYLNPSPATVKGNLKRPKKGIRSTRTKPLQALIPRPQQPAGTSIPRSPTSEIDSKVIFMGH